MSPTTQALVSLTDAEQKAKGNMVAAEKAREMVAGIEIKNQEDMEQAVTLTKGLASKKKAMGIMIKEIVKPAEDSIKAIKKFFKEPEQMYAEAEKIMKGKMEVYWSERDKNRATEQRRMAAEAEKKKKSILRRAETARKKGDYEKAAELDTQASGVLATIATEDDKPKGFSVRYAWKANVIDKTALIQAVARGEAEPALLAVDTKALNALATATRGTRHVPGVVFAQDKSVVIRTGGD